MNFIDNFLYHLNNALSTAYGWLLVGLTAVFTFIQPESTTFAVVGFALLADLFWGIAAAVKLKKFFLSKAFRETVKKTAIYSFALVGVFAMEKIAHESGAFIAVKSLGIFAAVCEFWSMSASMLIVKPNMPFLRIFRKQLLGEIQAKMGKNVNVEEFFNIDESLTGASDFNHKNVTGNIAVPKDLDNINNE